MGGDFVEEVKSREKLPQMFFDLRKPAAILALLFVSPTVHAWQQNALARHRALEEQQFKTANNAWMLTPIDVRSQEDRATSEDRLARDAYWDTIIGASAPLSEPGARSPGLGIGETTPDMPEFPARLDDGVWLIARFEGYGTFLANSHRSVYTEMYLRAIHIFGHPDVPGLAENSLLPADRPGGTVLTPWGATVTYEVHPNQYDFQPGHTYLVQLGYHPQGRFYSAGVLLSPRRWDLTDGTVRPNSHSEAHRYAQGRSEISGLKVSEMTQLLDRKFSAYYSKEH